MILAPILSCSRQHFRSSECTAVQAAESPFRAALSSAALDPKTKDSSHGLIASQAIMVSGKVPFRIDHRRREINDLADAKRRLRKGSFPLGCSRTRLSTIHLKASEVRGLKRAAAFRHPRLIAERPILGRVADERNRRIRAVAAGWKLSDCASALCRTGDFHLQVACIGGIRLQKGLV